MFLLEAIGSLLKFLIVDNEWEPLGPGGDRVERPWSSGQHHTVSPTAPSGRRMNSECVEVLRLRCPTHILPCLTFKRFLYLGTYVCIYVARVGRLRCWNIDRMSLNRMEQFLSWYRLKTFVSLFTPQFRKRLKFDTRYRLTLLQTVDLFLVHKTQYSVV